MVFEVIISFEVDKGSGIQADENIRLIGPKSAEDYPKSLRTVVFMDPVTVQEQVFLTSNLSWTAETIAALYRERWHIEVLFKQIKTHLRIKTFVGTSENAV